MILADAPVLDTGNTSWLLTSSALVLLMTPGLAFFYGGLNRSKSVLNMMMMSFSSIGLVSILWLFYGFTLAFGGDHSFGNTKGIWGNSTEFLGTKNLSGVFWLQTGIPVYVFMAFQMMFAIITVALISGALSDRTKFAGWLIFSIGWFTLAYVPIAHMVWGGGFIGGQLGALDFAGGSAVHINAGSAALALAIVLGKRVGWPKESFRPHNVPFVALGAGLLWFGWFGFNAGSEVTADPITAVAFINTQMATAAALMGWIMVEWIKGGKPTLVGASSGAVAGLVAITPACAYISPLWATVLGVVAGAVCSLTVSLKYKLGFDDSLDVVGVHFFGGWIGCLWIGFFADKGFGGSYVQHGSVLYGHDFTQLKAQFYGAGIVTVWSFTVALVLGFAIKAVGLFRAKKESELDGIDIAEHAESAYDFSQSGSGSSTGAFAQAGIGTPVLAGSHTASEAPTPANV